MKPDLRRQIIRCLGVSGPRDQHVRGLESFSSRDWDSALTWLNLSGIALTFWDRLQNSRGDRLLPRPASIALGMSLDDNRARVAAMADEFGSLNLRLASAGIDYVVWKGFALVPDYCPDAWLRPTYDYDYIVSPRDWEHAQRLMLEAGYTRKDEPDTERRITFLTLPTSARPTFPHSFVGLYAFDLPRKVELHLSPWDEKGLRISFSLPDFPLDRKVRRNWRGLTFFSLGDQDAFIFQALHTFQHILHNWCRLGWLWEIAYFLQRRSSDEAFWEGLCTTLDGAGPMREAVGVVVLLAADLFHATVPESFTKRVFPSMRPEVALWAQRYGFRSALDNFSGNKYALFLHRMFVDDAEWEAIRKNRLIPLNRPNRLAGSATPTNGLPMPEAWRQVWYVVQRLFHHSAKGAGYAWESLQWDRVRRLTANRASD